MADEKNKPFGNQSIDKGTKKLTKQEEQQQLLFKADALLPEKSFVIELEKYQLQNGLEFTLKEVNDLVISHPRDYYPMFPNKKPFFSLMYKLCGWKHLDPKRFIKPRVVSVYIRKYIYSRFHKDLLPTLLNIENPIIIRYIKKYKLFQFLNDEGIEFMETIIQQAIDVMEVSKDWYDFELKYTKLYNLPVQMRLL